jgi:hypothetical protein
VASCRQAALDAASRGDFETFHDLAWRAVQKGRPNDPELMALLARAQSLSGRPGDALVMLRRLAQMGIATDASTSEDFRRVRALPGWPDVEAMLKGQKPPEESKPPPTDMPGAASTRPGAGVPLTRATTGAAAPAARMTAAAGAPLNDEILPESLAAIQPAGLAYDVVSRRFIVGDRRENKLVVFDEVFKRATDMVGAESAGFFGLAAVEIDRLRGDLWVANSSAARGASLHKLQLVSGRVLFELAVPEALGPASVVDAAVVADGQVLLLDAQGRRLLRLSPARRTFERAAAADVDGASSLASSKGKVVYVAHRGGILRVDLAAGAAAPVRNAPAGLLRIREQGGSLIGVQSASDGHRIVRLRLDAAGRRVTRVEELEASTTMPDPSGITVAEGIVHYVTLADGSPIIRRIRPRK